MRDKFDLNHLIRNHKYDESEPFAIVFQDTHKIDIVQEGCECVGGGGPYRFSKSHLVVRRGRQGRADDIQVMYGILMLGGVKYVDEEGLT